MSGIERMFVSENESKHITTSETAKDWTEKSQSSQLQNINDALNSAEVETEDIKKLKELITSREYCDFQKEIGCNTKIGEVDGKLGNKSLELCKNYIERSINKLKEEQKVKDGQESFAYQITHPNRGGYEFKPQWNYNQNENIPGPISPGTSAKTHVVKLEKPYELTDEEYQKFLATVYSEAADNLSDSLGVASTILNRVESGKYGNSITSVISAPHQFSGYGNKKYQEAIKNPSKISDNIKEAVNAALNGIRNVRTYSFRGNGKHNKFF